MPVLKGNSQSLFETERPSLCSQKVPVGVVLFRGIYFGHHEDGQFVVEHEAEDGPAGRDRHIEAGNILVSGNALKPSHGVFLCDELKKLCLTVDRIKVWGFHLEQIKVRATALPENVSDLTKNLCVV